MNIENMITRNKNKLDVSPEWRSKWIWDAFHQFTTNSYLLIKKEFIIPENAIPAKLHIYCACRSEYKLYLNNCYIGRGSAAAKSGFVFYDEYWYDLPNIEFKQNYKLSVFAVCYNYGVGLHARPHNQAGFICQIDIMRHNSILPICQTDDSWDVLVPEWWKQDAPQRFWTIGFQEIVDLQKYESTFNARNTTIKNLKTDNYISQNPMNWKNANWEKAVVIIEQNKTPILLKNIIPHLDNNFCEPIRVAAWGDVIAGTNYLCKDNVACHMSNEKIISPINNRFSGIDEEGHFTKISICKSEKKELYLKSDYSAAIIFDFGNEKVGYPLLHFKTTGSGFIDIGYSELLESDNNINPMRQNIGNADRIIFYAGNHNWEMFNRRAFRYMQLTFRGQFEHVQIEGVFIRELKYPFVQRGLFECSNSDLNKIFQTSLYTLETCIKDTYEDCPLREGAQYLGDMRIQALAGYYAFGEYRLAKKALKQFALEQNESGWMKSISPGATQHNIVDYLPFFVIALKEYYWHSGDIMLVKELYKNAISLMHWFTDRFDADGLIMKEPSWWIFIDWAEIERNGSSAALLCMVRLGFLALIDLAEALHDDETIKWARHYAEYIKNTFNHVFWDENLSIYRDCLGFDGQLKGESRQTLCLAIISGMVPERYIEKIRSAMLNMNHKVIKTGYFKSFEMEAWWLLGEYNRFIEEFDYWIKMIEYGATTWWEIFDPQNVEKSKEHSLCHAWSSGPITLMQSKIAGIRPLTPGFKDIIIEPFLGALTKLYSVVPIPCGKVCLSIEMQDSKCSILIHTPKDTRVSFVFDSKWKMHPVSTIPVFTTFERKHEGLSKRVYIFTGSNEYSFLLEQLES